jgi:hypothetical protein
MSSLKYWVPVEVGANGVKRENALVSIHVDFQRILNQFTNKWFNPDSVTVFEVDGSGKEREIPSQYDGIDGTVSWIMDGITEPDRTRFYKIGFDVLGRELPFKTRYPRYESNVDLWDLGGRLWIFTGGHIWGGRHFTTYIYGGESVTVEGSGISSGGDRGGPLWKPSFCPINGPNGNLVRESEPEHPHQHGLYLAYGAHISAEGTNIWAETVKGPWGPCGRIVHEKFDYLTNGPIYGRIIEKLAYVKPDGYKFMFETRDIKVYNLQPEAMIMDISSTFTCPNEVGVRVLILALRVANSIQEIKGGKIENSEGGVGQQETTGKRAKWVDYSGPVGSGWNGIAIFDNESNPGFPASWSTNAGPMAIITTGYQWPNDFPLHGFLRLKWRFYVHDGDARKGKVEEKYQEYVIPLNITFGKPFEK